VASSTPEGHSNGPRASDADREWFISLLHEHFAQGRLSFEELSERVKRALAAQGLTELYALINDLPHLVAPLERKTPQEFSGHNEVPSKHHGARRKWWRRLINAWPMNR
jgi:Domain of unknown function (DUF1707).